MNGTTNGSSNGSSNGSVNGSDVNPAVRVGVLFAGRQASGGHNIIWGLHEYLKGTGSTVSVVLVRFLACFHTPHGGGVMRKMRLLSLLSFPLNTGGSHRRTWRYGWRAPLFALSPPGCSSLVAVLLDPSTAVRSVCSCRGFFFSKSNSHGHMGRHTVFTSQRTRSVYVQRV